MFGNTKLTLPYFYCKSLKVKMNSLSENTIIEDDLGISGDDAYEFIFAYGELFNVDIKDFYSPQKEPEINILL
jgi:acyl carrier protein